jgi:hypothetical protein
VVAQLCNPSTQDTESESLKLSLDTIVRPYFKSKTESVGQESWRNGSNVTYQLQGPEYNQEKKYIYIYMYTYTYKCCIDAKLINHSNKPQPHVK